jgi:hypothetical protein
MIDLPNLERQYDEFDSTSLLLLLFFISMS